MIYVCTIHVIRNSKDHWVIARDVPSTSLSHGDNSGAHGEPYSKHMCGYFLIVSLAEMEVASSVSSSPGLLELSRVVMMPTQSE